MVLMVVLGRVVALLLVGSCRTDSPHECYCCGQRCWTTTAEEEDGSSPKSIHHVVRMMMVVIVMVVVVDVILVVAVVVILILVVVVMVMVMMMMVALVLVAHVWPGPIGWSRRSWFPGIPFRADPARVAIDHFVWTILVIVVRYC